MLRHIFYSVDIYFRKPFAFYLLSIIVCSKLYFILYLIGHRILEKKKNNNSLFGQTLTRRDGIIWLKENLGGTAV